MKKIVLLIGMLTTFSVVEAQLLKKIKDKVDKKVDKTADDATEKRRRKKILKKIKLQSQIPIPVINLPQSKPTANMILCREKK